MEKLRRKKRGRRRNGLSVVRTRGSECEAASRTGVGARCVRSEKPFLQAKAGHMRWCMRCMRSVLGRLGRVRRRHIVGGLACDSTGENPREYECGECLKKKKMHFGYALTKCRCEGQGAGRRARPENLLLNSRATRVAWRATRGGGRVEVGGFTAAVDTCAGYVAQRRRGARQMSERVWWL